MPSVPIPQQVPIQRAGWSPDLQAGGLLAPPSNERTPVNPIMSALNQGQIAAQTQLQGAAAANQLNDVQMKQRQMQLSMLAGLDNIQDPAKRAEATPSIVAMANRLNPSYQIDPNLDDATRHALIMSAVPVEQQPNYAMTQQQAGLLGALRDRLAPPAAAPMAAPMAAPTAAVAPTMGNPAPVTSPAPSQTSGAAGSLTDPNTMALMAVVNPNMANALTQQQRASYESPQGRGAIKSAEAQAQNQADAFKNQQETQNKTNIMLSNSKAMLDIGQDLLTAHPDIANSTAALYAARKSQQINPFGNKDIDEGITKLETYGSSDLLPSIRQFLQGTGQVRVFEGINLDKIFSYDPSISLKANMDKWQVATQQIQLGQQGADNLTKAIETGQIQGKGLLSPSISGAAGQANSALQPKGQNTPPLIKTKAAFDALPSGTIYMEADGKKYRKP